MRAPFPICAAASLLFLHGAARAGNDDEMFVGNRADRAGNDDEMFVGNRADRAGNDDEMFVGNRAAMAGGAVSATVADASATRYNPAGLGSVERAQIDVSGTAYSVRIYSVPRMLSAANGASKDGSVTEFISIPSQIAYVRRLAPGVSLGLGYFVPRASSFVLREELDVGDASVGSQWQVAATVSDMQHMAAAGVGVALSPAVRIGASLLGGYAANTQGLTFFGRIEENGATASFASQSALGTFSRMNLESAVGLQAELGRDLSLGLTVRTPRVQLYENHRLMVSQGGAITHPVPTVFSTAAEPSHDGTGLALLRAGRAAVALAYRHGAGWIAAEIDVQPALSRPAVDVHRKAVVNARLGAYHAVLPAVALGAGLFTDRSADAVAGGLLSGTGDFYGGTLGIELGSMSAARCISDPWAARTTREPNGWPPPACLLVPPHAMLAPSPHTSSTAEPSYAAERAKGARGYAMVAGAAVSWSFSGPALRAAERYGSLSAALEAGFVFGVAGLLVAPFAIAERRRDPRIRPLSAWGALALLGALDALNSLFFFAAIQKTTLAIAVLTHYLAPLLVAAASPLLLGERSSRGSWGALALSLLGLALLLEPWRGQDDSKIEGALLGAASAVFFAGNVVLSKGLGRRFAPLEIFSYHALVASAALLAFVPRGGFDVHAPALGVLTAQGILICATGGTLFLRGLARVPASHASTLTLLEPAVAVALAALLFGELPGPWGALGGASILLGAYLVMRGAPPPPETHLANAALSAAPRGAEPNR